VVDRTLHRLLEGAERRVEVGAALNIGGLPYAAQAGGRFSMEEMTELKWTTIKSGQRAFPM
jgi:hypothetical protein